MVRAAWIDPEFQIGSDNRVFRVDIQPRILDLEFETEDRFLGTFALFHLLGVVVEHHVHICCLIALGSVSGQFRFAGRLDLIEPKSFALMRKFRCGMSIQMAYF